MKSPRSLILILILLIPALSFSQRRFIKVNSAIDFGRDIRIVSVADQGWIIASMDSLRLARYDKCGKTIWGRKLNAANTHSSINDIITLRNTDILILTRILPGIRYGLVLTRIDTSGTVVWSRSYEDQTYDQFGYTLGEDKSGNIFLFSGVSEVSVSAFNMLVKMNSAGTTLWTKFYDHGGTYGGSVVTSDYGVLFRAGNIFVKTDSAGNVQWTNHITSANSYHYTSPIEVSNGYVFTKYNSSSGANIFYKIDKPGNLVEAKISNYNAEYPRLKVTTSGTILGIFNPGNHPTIVEMDKDLHVLRQGSVDFGGMQLFGEDFSYSGGDVVIAGTTNTQQMFFAKLDDLFKSSCDIALPLMDLQPEQAQQLTFSTTVFNHTLTEVIRNYQTTIVADEEFTLCTVPLELALGPDTTVCLSTDFLLRNNLFGLFDEYLWSTGETTPFIHISGPGQYWLQAKQYCEDSTATDTIAIKVDSVPGLEAGEILACEETSVVLHAPVCNCTYEWNTGDTADSLEVISAGNYTLRVENQHQCFTVDSINIDFALCECELWIPNSFTPNNDDVNEIFKPVYHCEMTDYELKIFNRLGKIVFTSTNPEEGWNGNYKSAAGIEDVYNYSLQYNPLIKGVKTELVKKNGRVALIF